MSDLNNLLHQYIPGGCHTYSKGTDQYLNFEVPTSVSSRGVWTKSADNVEYLDWMMGNRVICLGHANKYVDNRVIQQLRAGANHSLPSVLELRAAKYFVEQLKLGEMVKFGKNGSDAVSAAIRLSRAYTQKSKILICSDQPFYAIHDWFIGTTASNAGVDMNTQENILKFSWNDVNSLQAVIESNEGTIACILLEVCKFEPPSPEFINYLNQIKQTLEIVLIADENINCMKFGIKGAYNYFGLKPDLVCYGKAIANGFSFSLLAGPRRIMEYGGTRANLPKVFLLSQTHSSESTGIAAAMATCEYYLKHDVESHIKKIGYQLKHRINQVISTSHLHKKVYLGGLDQNPSWVTQLDNPLDNLRLRSWLVSSMIKHRILINWITITSSHKEKHIKQTCDALQRILRQSSDADYLTISSKNLPMPVFRKHQLH